ncbi:hypothetical protein BS78_10G082700 [Paspalum vaginatum]|nr:hypothetical protein BS78_10G082700 [Paspalum vaginatum]
MEAFAVKARDEISSSDAPVEQGVAPISDGAIQPRRSLRVRAKETRQTPPRPSACAAPVRQDPALHALESVVADKLHTTAIGAARLTGSRRLEGAEVVARGEASRQSPCAARRQGHVRRAQWGCGALAAYGVERLDCSRVVRQVSHGVRTRRSVESPIRTRAR